MIGMSVIIDMLYRAGKDPERIRAQPWILQNGESHQILLVLA